MRFRMAMKCCWCRQLPAGASADCGTWVAARCEFLTCHNSELIFHLCRFLSCRSRVLNCSEQPSCGGFSCVYPVLLLLRSSFWLLPLSSPLMERQNVPISHWATA